MKSRYLPLLLATVAILLACSALAADVPRPAASPLAPLEWLIGDWQATAVAPGGKATEINSHIFWSETGQSINFVTLFSGQPRYSGFYAWDPARKQIVFWYTSTDGELIQGTATADGHRLLQKFEVAHTDGRTSALSSVIVRQPDATGYHWQVFGPGNPTGKPLIELDYKKK